MFTKKLTRLSLKTAFTKSVANPIRKYVGCSWLYQINHHLYFTNEKLQHKNTHYYWFRTLHCFPDHLVFCYKQSASFSGCFFVYFVRPSPTRYLNTSVSLKEITINCLFWIIFDCFKCLRMLFSLQLFHFFLWLCSLNIPLVSP